MQAKDDRNREHKHTKASAKTTQPRRDPYLRAANEDDDGYDPYSDRPARPEPLFQEDPWR